MNSFSSMNAVNAARATGGMGGSSRQYATGLGTPAPGRDGSGLAGSAQVPDPNHAYNPNQQHNSLGEPIQAPMALGRVQAPRPTMALGRVQPPPNMPPPGMPQQQAPQFDPNDPNNAALAGYMQGGGGMMGSR